MPDTAARHPGHYQPQPVLLKASTALILRLQDRSGAYPASPTFSAYAGYCWFRDGAFIAEAMRVSGHQASAARFHQWCVGVVLAQESRIRELVSASRAGVVPANADMLPTRYRLDGSVGTDQWWDFQLDGYGTWLWTLARHVQDEQHLPHDWARAVTLVVLYLSEHWQRPCYDWWEEHPEARHTSTLACVRAGLDAVLGAPSLRSGLTDAEQDQARAAIRGIDAAITTSATSPGTPGHLVKWLGSNDVDASLLVAVSPLELPIPTPVLTRTIEVIEDQLAEAGGVYRYRDDTYYGGGRWPLLSGFLALAHIQAGQPTNAVPYLRWIEHHAGPNGHIPEQVSDRLLHPQQREEWVRRWGTPADPLLWSNAMYLLAAHAYTHALETGPAVLTS